MSLLIRAIGASGDWVIFQCDNMRYHIVTLHLLEFAGKVFLRGTCRVVRLVQVVLLAKSCILLENIRGVCVLAN